MSNRLSVRMITPTFFPTLGGAEEVIHQLSMELERAGSQVQLLAPRGVKVPKDAPYAVREQVHFARFAQSFAPLFEKSFGVGLLSSGGLGGDEVWNAHFAYPAGYGCLWARRLRKIPFFISVHGADVDTIPEINYGYPMMPKLRRKIVRALQAADGIICPSSYAARCVENLIGPNDRSHVIPHGIPERQVLSSPAWPGKEPYILSLGRFHPKKNFQALIRAYRRLRKQFSGDCPPLVIAGSGGEERRLKDLVSELGLDSHVRFPGAVQGEAKWKLIREARCFMTPSIHEFFGLVALEALAAGLPVVASNIPAFADFLQHDSNALMVDADKEFACAAAIQRVLEDESLSRRLAASALETARKLTWPEVTKRYQALYAQVVQRQHA